MGQYCDGTACTPGCDEQADCATSEVCDEGTHQCGCAAGTHRCGTACAADDDVDRCGASCTTCPSDPSGARVCSAGGCGLTCNQGSLLCGPGCATCPAGSTATQCSGNGCAATACSAGRLLCSGQCPACPSGAATGVCNAGACDAASCQAGRLLCQGQCPSCPAGAATTQCAGNTCEAATCSAGRLLCGGQCPQCPANAAATACSGTACVATACGAGFATCGGSCVPCAPGQLFCCREPVDSNVGPDHALGLDATGKAYVAYYASGVLKLAKSSPTGFGIVTVDTVGDVGQDVSIAVDAAGNVHLAYTRALFPEAVKYAYVPVTGAPVVETVESGLIATGATSVKLDVNGSVHLAYYADGDSHYAVKAGGVWRPRFAMEDGAQVSMALFGTTPHLVASSNPASGFQACSLAYGWLDAGTADGGFRSSTVSSSLGISQFHDATIAVDATGTPLVAYLLPNFQDLYFASRDGGGWNKEKVYDGIISDTQLAVGPEGPRIAFKGMSTGTSSRPRYAEATDAGWRMTVIVDQDITVGRLSLALDPTGRPNVTYWDPNPALKRVYWVH